MAWRLGLDLGTNSLGWAAIELDGDKPCGIIAAGSRIFSDGRDPKSGASLAVDRRDARAMRRRGDRFKQRQDALLKYLVADGLFPADDTERKALAGLDPYAVRARALDEKLTLAEIGRAFFHLNQRRGFQSNRKADRGADEEAGKIATGVGRLREKIAEKEAAAGAEPGSWTFGKWLHERRRPGMEAPNSDAKKQFNQSAVKSVRTRLRAEIGEGAKGDGYDFYPDRALLKEEFAAIWEAQAPHHPNVLTPDVHKHLWEIVFHQRPLRPVEIGQCTLVPGEKRLHKAHPLFQRRRFLEEINALMIVRPGEKAERLTPEQRDLVLRIAPNAKAQISFNAIRKTLKTDGLFNKESENRPFILGDEVAAQMGTKARFGTRWAYLSTDEQWGIITRQQDVESDADDAAFRAWVAEHYDLTPEQAKAVANARLPDGVGRFGPTATTQLIEALQTAVTPQGRLPGSGPIEAGRVVVYSEAVVVAGFGHHSDLRTGEVFEENGVPTLPYYGLAVAHRIMPGNADPEEKDEAKRFGRLTNPTVHIGLNQLRRVVNRLIATHGPPKEIALELARELKLSDEEKKERNKQNTKNRQDAEGRSNKLLGYDADGNPMGQKIADDTGANRARLKLWEELNPHNVLDRRCIYSGRQISIDMLFSAEVEVDHILPYAKTLDDSNGNKILCMREANREKSRRSPYETWGHTDRWEAIAERASHLPKNKRRKFEPDAMERAEADGGFLARQLTDTQHLSRLAREYLTALYPGEGENSSHVWVSPGRLTEMIRRKLGLNSLLPDHNLGGGAGQPKNRLDHRHHAIDAAVVAITDRGLLNKMARESGQGASDADLQILVPKPWDTFRDDLSQVVNAITVSHRVDQGTVSKVGLKPGRDQTAGRLHNDTAYGFTGDSDAKGNTIVVHRVPLGSFKKPADLERVRDPQLRAALVEFTQGLDGKAFEARLARFPELGALDYRGVRRIRVIEPLSVIPIRNAQGKAYKGYKGDSNYRYDIWEMPDGKWRCDVVSMFAAHQPGERPRPHPAARRIMALHQNDLVAIEPDGCERRVMRVVKFGQDGRLYLAEPQESGALKTRDADKGDPFRYESLFPAKQKAWRARKVSIDEIGQLRDPGFGARTARRVTRPKLAPVQ